ncbi:HYR domain-containing protein [Urechidicola vernalis]|uniref:HYR domain-containing protein n=1 Tax=Urechidicola vernalis TaxID=3075600 RepID=A0ABU2Y960_9FLAO|nr:HYR domain-containing protein [Urechidicola sp. P050]MDT0553603.1 HYR domain-containing protein [Urechidicola sp. P050]
MPQNTRTNRYHISFIVSVFMLLTVNLIAQTADCIPDNTLDIYLDASGNASITVANINAGASMGSTISLDKYNFTCTDIGQVTVTLSADNGGTPVSCSTIVNVIDNIPPTIGGSGNVIENTSVDGFGDCTSEILVSNVFFSDACSIPTLSWATTGATILSGMNQVGRQIYNVGTTTITYTVIDASLNSNTYDIIVTVIDDENPTISCIGDQTRNTVTEECYYTVVGTEFDPTVANDNCGGAVVINDFNNSNTLAGAQIPDGTTIVWSINDGTFSETCSFDVSVIDNEAPTVVASSDRSGNSSDDGPGNCTLELLIGNAIPSDNCSGTNLTWAMSGATTGSGSGQVGRQFYNVGTTIITYTVTDDEGLTGTDFLSITITDDENPVLSSCPPDISQGTDSSICGAIVAWTPPTAADNCGVTVSSTHNPGDTFPVGTTTVTYTATDGEGLIDSCSFDVVITDVENPIIVCPSDIIVNADSFCEATTVNLGTPTTSDNCGVASVTNNAPSTFPLGTVQVTWTVTDTAGLIATCIQNVTVVDATPPTITCPSNVTVSADLGLCTASGVSLATPTYSDNCSVGISNDAPATFPLGDTTVIWTATDGAGLTTTCVQTVTVEDNEAPVAVCKDLTLQLAPGTGTLTVLGSQVDNGSTDNCSTNFSLSQSSFTCADIGDNVVTFTVTDDAGNTDTCSAIITITDAAENASVSIAAADTTVCQGIPTTFTATPTNGGTTPMYQWQINGSEVGAPTTSSTFVTSTLNQNDIVTVSMTSDLSVCATSQLSNSIQMTVNSLLPVSFSIVGNTIICEGELTTFLPGTITNGGSNPSYQWYLNGTPTVTTINYTTSGLSNGDVVTLEVSSDANCANPVPASESITITVNPLPTVTALIDGSSSNVTICSGDTVTLTGSGASSYTWDNGVSDGDVVSPSTTMTYTVTGTDGSSCENSDTITVTVTPDATIGLISAAGTESQNVCSGSAMTPITYQLTNATGANVIGTLPSGVLPSFDPGTGIFTISGNPTTTETTTGDFYSFSIEAIGCNPASIDAFIGVYGAAPAAPTSHDGPYNICVGAFTNNATVNFSIPVDPNVVAYNWGMPNGSFNITDGDNTDEVTVNITQTYDWGRAFQPQTYVITVSTINPCGTSSDYTFEIELQYLDVLDITAGEDIYVCEDTSSIDMAGGTDGPLGSGLDYDEWDWFDATGTDDNFDHDATYQECVRVCTRYWPWGWCRTYTETCTDETHPELDSNYNLPTSNSGDIHTIILEGGNGTCDTVTDEINIYVIEKPSALLGVDITICENNTTEITITGTEFTDITYSYNSGSETGTITLDATGNATFTTVALMASTTFSLTSANYNNSRFPSGTRNETCTEALTESLDITVEEAPTVDAGVNQTICSSDTATMAGTIGGSNPSGTWSTNGFGSFNNDTPLAIYTPHALDVFFSPITLTYTNTPTGECSPVSDTMQLTISEEVTITTQPQNRTVCAGNTTTFSVGATGDGLTYQWYRNASLISGATSNSYTASSLAIGDDGDNYYVIVGGSGICSNVQSNTVSISVNEIGISSQPTNVAECEGNNVSFSVVTTGTVSTYQWYRNGVVISGANSTTLNISNIDSSDAGNYYVVMTGPYCSNVTSATASLAVTSIPTVNLSYNTSVFCNSNSSVSPSLIGTDAYIGGSYSYTGSGTLDLNTSTGVIDPSGSTAGTYIVLYDTPTGVCATVQAQTTVTINEFNSAAEAGTSQSTGACNNTTVTLSADPLSVAGASGVWTVISGQLASSYVFSDVNSPVSTFTGQSGESYTLQWSITSASPCSGSSDTTQVTFANCGSFIDFDGTDDYISFGDNYDRSGNFSIEAWVKSESNSGTKTILSKRDASDFTDGYDLRIQGNNFSFRYNGSGLITSSRAMTTDRWYHVAISFDGSTYRMYQDGILVNSTSGTLPSSNSDEFLIGAMDRSVNVPTNYFNGWLDEVRLWSVVLTQDQIREMMNQEIENSAGNVQGATIPKDVSGLSWASLDGYYQMNQSTDLASGYLASKSASGFSGNLINITSSQSESAPLPYNSTTSGDWTNSNTWLNGNVQITPNNTINGTEVIWNIVETNHNVSSGDKDITLLGLFVNDDKLSIENSDAVSGGQSVRVTSYLSIDGNGVLDLVGESQLLQDEDSWINEAGTGYLERDQQGTANSFAYNYWSSPVSLSSGAGNNLPFTLNDVLFDGRDPDNPRPIKYGDRYDYYFADGGSTSSEQLKLATSWIYKYAYSNRVGAYANWEFVGNIGTLNVTEGFSMKGASGAISLDLGVASQNLVYRGKPNNIPNGETEMLAVDFATSGIDGQYVSLIGNPFPSAIDANEFLADNSASTDGTLLFWEHWSDNTHIVRSYQGGYAVYNSSGGNQATSQVPHPNNPTITPGSSPRRVPQRYIPIGQGFMVKSSALGGRVVFKNSQRIFYKETGSSSNYIKPGGGKERNIDIETDDGVMRIRLGIDTPQGIHRPLLIAFLEGATDAHDHLFDAEAPEQNRSDAFMLLEDEKFIIQGFGEFKKEREIPIILDIAEEDEAYPFKFMIDGLENFPDEIEIYVKDFGNNGETYNIRNSSSFDIKLKAGEYKERFALVFRSRKESVESVEEIEDAFKVYTNKEYKEIRVVKTRDVDFNNITLFNSIGQQIAYWNTNLNKLKLNLPVHHLSTGVYILTIDTPKGSISKKLLLE